MAAPSLPATLAAGMARQAHGHAAVIDGNLDIRTATAAPNWAAMNALHVLGFHVSTSCRDPECTCLVRALARLRPDVRIVPVTIQVNADA